MTNKINDGFTISQPFGPTNVGLEPALYGYPHFHTGLDIEMGTGTEIHTVEDADVLFAGRDNIGYGNRVVVRFPNDHNVIETFDHLSEVDVHTGDHLTGNKMIGKSGATGNVTGPHLHWEVLFPQSADPTNPDRVSKIPDTNISGYVYEDPAKVDPSGQSWSTRATGVLGALNPFNDLATAGDVASTAANDVGSTISNAFNAAAQTIGKGLLIFGLIVLGALIIGVGLYSTSKS